MNLTFESVSELRKRAAEVPQWIVPGLVSSSTTLLTGRSEAGKSMLVASLLHAVTTGNPFLGRKPTRTLGRVLVAYTDDAGGVEYIQRLERAGYLDAVDGAVSFCKLPIMRKPEQWEELRFHVNDQGYDLVVVDNLSQVVHGSLRNDEDIREAFDGIRSIVDDSVPVVVVGHTSEKRDPNGHNPEDPLGSSGIVQSVRHRLFIKKFDSDPHKRVLKVEGNHTTGEVLELHMPDPGAPAYTVVNAQTAQERHTAKVEGRKTRSREKLDANAEITDWIVTNCRGLSQRQAAEKLAAARGTTTEAARNRIRRAPVKLVGSEWVKE